MCVLLVPEELSKQQCYKCAWLDRSLLIASLWHMLIYANTQHMRYTCEQSSPRSVDFTDNPLTRERKVVKVLQL